MKDFALIAGSSGSFPDVVSTDCSGVGETDGFAVISDYLNDSGLGWIQALLNEVGDTPNGSTESDSGGSQILDALRILAAGPELIPQAHGRSRNVAGTEDWIYSPKNWTAVVNSGVMEFPISLPSDVTIDVDVSVYVLPGAVRAGGNRMSIGLYYRNYSDASDTSQIGSTVYDDGTAAGQTILFQTTSLATLKTREYVVKIAAGNTAAASNDLLYSVKREVTLS